MASQPVYDEVATSRQLRGVEEILWCWQLWKEAMPGVNGRLTNALAAGNPAIIEVTWTGTHTGPLEGPGGARPATGNQATVRAAWLMTFDKGKLEESRHCFDMYSLMQQLGALPKC